MSSSSSSHRTIEISSADCLRLILAHLTEQGLHATARTLQRESGVGLAASLVTHWQTPAVQGQWAVILQGLAVLDRERAHLSPQLLASVHEMAVLELAEMGDWDSAYAVVRLLQQDESLANAISQVANHPNQLGQQQQQRLSVSRSLEQKLAQLAAARQKDPTCAVPDDFYGCCSSSDNNNNNNKINNKQARREALGRKLQEAVPRQPTQRLVTLLQQAIKWQAYTGQLPRIRQWWENDNEDDPDETETDQQEAHDHQSKKRKRQRKEFDLLLGEAVSIGDTDMAVSTTAAAALKASKKHITKDYATISFGKKATCESAVFLADGTSGLVTGSSDGLVEVYDLQGNLRTDLAYQAKDEFMGHDDEVAVTALAVSNDGQLLASGAADGTVHVWGLGTGKRLRTIQTISSSSSPPASSLARNTGSNNNRSGGIVSCLALAPHGSQLLVAQGNDCREFGLRSGRMLKEFRGHTSYLTSCAYRLIAAEHVSSSRRHSNDDDEDEADEIHEQLIVATASGDGSVRIWNGTTADIIHVLQPVALGRHLSGIGSSLLTAAESSTDDRPVVHGLHPLHTPADTWIVVPRGHRAFLVNFTGRVLQIFAANDMAAGTHHSADADRVFVASAVSPSNRWLYTVQDDGSCNIYDVTTGQRHETIRDFGARSTGSSKGGGAAAEVSCLVHHPAQDRMAAFSYEKGQKKGTLVLWK